jgi:hypothetical protein
MKTFEVTIRYPEDLPLIGEVARVRVEAYTHRHATLKVRAMRKDKGWPPRCSYWPRIVDSTTYQQHFLDSQTGAILDRMPRLTGASA